VLVLALGGPHTPPVDKSRREPTERYEPLPGVAQLPGWALCKLGPRLRVVLVLALLAAVAGALALAPALRERKQERVAQERRERAAQREAAIRRLQVEQRPRFRVSRSVAPAGAGPATRLEARAELMDDLSAAIEADARRRVRRGVIEGPILRVGCEPFPRTLAGVGADRELARRSGRYACLAVRAEFERSEASVGGALGYPYRAKVDFESGRYAYCKISGRPGPTPDPRVTTPRACGG
jgi:hypothetical protein